MRYLLAFLLLSVVLPGTIAAEFRPLVLGADGKTKQFPNGTDTLRVVPSYGLAASVPTASADNTGQIYITTDTATILRSNGTTWESVTLPSGTAGGDLGGTYPNPTVAGASDNIFSIYDNTDPTKLFAWTLGNQTTGTTFTVNSGAQSASRQLSVPVLAGDDTIAVIGQAQTFTGAQTFSTPVAPDSGGTGVNNGAFALTIPATGTANLLGTAQTITAAKTHTDAEVVLRNTDNTSAATVPLRIERGSGAGNDAEIRTTGDTSNGVASLALRLQGADYLTVSGAAITGLSPFIAPAATTGIPSIRLPHGAAPTFPTNGDIWTTTSGAYVRVNGATVGPLIDASAGGAVAAFWAGISSATPISITAAGATATANRMHLVSDPGVASYDITLPAAPASGTVVGFTVAYNALASKEYRLDAGVGIIICGRTRYLTLVHTNAALLRWNGTYWEPLVLCLDTQWIDGGAPTVTAVTTGPTPGGGTTYNKVYWRRSGGSMEARYSYRHTTAGAAGSGDYLWPVPIGTINTALVDAETSANSANVAATFGIGCGRYDSAGTAIMVWPGVYDSTRLRVFGLNNNVGGSGTMGSAYGAWSGAAIRFMFTATLPMTNW